MMDRPAKSDYFVAEGDGTGTAYIGPDWWILPLTKDQEIWNTKKFKCPVWVIDVREE